MNPAVLIPYRARDIERMENLSATRRPYDALDWPVCLGDHPGDPFCRSRAINAAASIAPSETDVFYISDVDILIPSVDQLYEAVTVAYVGDCYTVSFSRLRVLDPEGSDRVRAGRPPDPRHEIETVSLIWGCAFAIGRSLFDRMCGFDERFVGYGSEDLAVIACANTLGGRPKQRVNGDAWHLSHPENQERDHYVENARLASRYRSYDGDPEGMRALLAERGCP